MPIRFGIERCRYLVDQCGQVGRSADLAELPLAVEFLADRQQVDRDALLVQAREGFPDPTMPVNVKIVGLQELGDVVVDLWVNEHRPYDGFFGFSAVGCCRRRWRGGGGECFRLYGIRHFFFGLLGLSDLSGFSASGLSSVSLSSPSALSLSLSSRSRS